MGYNFIMRIRSSIVLNIIAFVFTITVFILLPYHAFADTVNQTDNKQEKSIQISSAPRVWFGAQFNTITEELANKRHLEKKDGVLVEKVFPGSPAEKAGVKLGDIILEANGQRTYEGTDIPKLVKSLSVGDVINLKIFRDKKELFIKVTLEKFTEVSSPQMMITKLRDSALELSSKMDMKNSIEVMIEARRLQEKHFGKNNDDYLTIAFNLFLFYKNVDDFKSAEEVILEIVEIVKTLNGSNNDVLINLYIDIAEFYENNKKYDQAERYHREITQLRKKLYGIKSDQHIDALHRLTVFLKRRGRGHEVPAVYTEIPDYYETMLNYRKEMDVDGVRDVGDRAIDLLEAENKIFESVWYLKNKLDEQKKLINENSPDYPWYLTNQAHLYFMMNDYGKAEALYKHVLSIIKKRHGEDHEDYVKATVNYACANYKRMRNNSEKLEFENSLKLAIAKLERIKKTKTITYAETLDQLAFFYETENLGKLVQREELFIKARDLHERSKEIRREVLGAQNLTFARYLTKLMPDCARYNPKMDWKAWFDEGMNIQKKIFGDKHPEYSKSLINYADVVLVREGEKKDDFKENEAIMNERFNLYQQALVNFILMIGKDNLEYIDAIARFADLYYDAAFFGQKVLYGGSSSFSIETSGGTRDENKFQLASTLYNQAIYLSEATYGKKHPKYLIALARKGFVAKDNVPKLYAETMTIQKEIFGEQHLQYALTMFYLASTYTQKYKEIRNEKDFRASEELIKKALKIFRDHFGERNYVYAVYLESLAGLYKLKDRKKAEEIYKQVLVIQQNTIGETDSRYIITLFRYAQLFLDKTNPDYPSAIKIYENTINIVEKTFSEKDVQYMQSITQSATTLAVLYENTGDYGKAEELRKKMRDLANKSEKDYIKKIRRLDIASAVSQIDIGEYDQAKNTLLKLLSSMTDEEDPVTCATAQHRLAEIYYIEQNYGQAEEYYKKSLDTLKRSFQGIDIDNMPHFGSTNYFGLAKTCHAAGDYLRAEEYYKKVLITENVDLNTDTNNPDAANHLMGLGNLYATLGDFVKAEPHFIKGIPIYAKAYGQSHPSYAGAVIDCANMYASWRKASTSFQYYIDGLNAQDSFVTSMALWAPEARVQSYIKSVDLTYDRFYNLLAANYVGSNDKVEKALQMHLNYKGKTTELLATRNRLVLYSKNENLLKKINELKKVTQELSMLTLSGIPEGMQQDTYRKKMDMLTKQRGDVEAALAKSSSEFAEKQALKQVTAEDVAASLPVGVVYLDLVEYRKYDYDARKWTDEKRYLAFLLTRDSSGKANVRIEDLGPADKIDAMVSTLRKELKKETGPERGVGGKRIVTRTKQTANIVKSDVSTKLYEKVLSPFKEEISKATTLYIAPSGSLNLIPFEVLTEPGQKGYLCDRISVIYSLGRDLYAAKLKMNQTSEEKPSQQISVVAAPSFSIGKDKATLVATVKASDTPKVLSRGAVRGWPIKFDELPGTLEEANAISKLAEGKDIELLIKEKALEENVKKMKHPRVLHLATHGFFLDDIARTTQEETRGVGGIRVTGKGESLVEAPVLKGPVELHDPLLRSGLALTGANRLAENAAIPEGNEDGILTAAEVTGMDLYGTNLVVLSACDTGLGDVHRGNGVSGLRRAFKIAGARNIIMSLWSVPDQETGWLMEEFYRNYFKGDNPAVALNKARVTLRQKLIARDGVDHPFYWAAFILEGTSI